MSGTLQYYCFDTIDDNYVYIDDDKQPHNTFSYHNLNSLISLTSAEPPLERIEQTSFDGKLLLIGKLQCLCCNLHLDCLMYIYTSGTEGLPKAAIIKHSRFIWMGAAVKYMVLIRSADVLYTSLPLYHLAGGTVGICQCLTFGNTMAIRNKFSASNFWKDCVKYKCTVSRHLCVALSEFLNHSFARWPSISARYADIFWRSQSLPTTGPTRFVSCLEMDFAPVYGQILFLASTSNK